jgi:hypothetical protein
LEDLATAEGCDMLHWMKTIEGLVMGVQCFGGELPFLFLSGWYFPETKIQLFFFWQELKNVTFWNTPVVFIMSSDLLLSDCTQKLD